MDEIMNIGEFYQDKVCKRIYSRIEQEDLPVAVFKSSDKFRAVPVSAAVVQKAQRGFESRLLGIYDKNCDPQWLLDDLNWADINLV